MAKLRLLYLLGLTLRGAEHALLLPLAYDACVGLSRSILSHWLNVLLSKVDLGVILDLDDLVVLIHRHALLLSSQIFSLLATLILILDVLIDVLRSDVDDGRRGPRSDTISLRPLSWLLVALLSDLSVTVLDSSHLFGQLGLRPE